MFQSLKKLFAPAPGPHGRPRSARLAVEGLEDRKLLTAGITLAADGVIRVEGYDDAAQGEAVSVRTLTNNTLSAYDDQIQVSMSYGRRVDSQTFDLWKFAGRRQFTAAVIRVDYSGLGGNDSFFNRSGVAATADGGAGDDRLQGGSAQDVLFGGAGNDRLTGGLGSDKLNGGDGTDTLVESADLGFGLSNSGVTWTDGTTDLFGQIEAADVTGGAGHNVMNAQAFSGNVTLRGGGGDDVLTGGAGVNVLHGEDGTDTLRGGGLADKLYGGLGNDFLFGMGGEDLLNGEEGDDTIRAGDGADLVYGGSGADQIHGESGDDEIYAGKGKDYLYGGADDDYLDGGYDRKVDHLYGEGGTDTFLQHVWADMDSYFVWEWDYYKDKVHDKEQGEQVYQVQN